MAVKNRKRFIILTTSLVCLISDVRWSARSIKASRRDMPEVESETIDHAALMGGEEQP
jgi:hypothetical protein